MLPKFLLPETLAREDGVGAKVAFESKILQLTLGITRSIEQESLDVSVWGSADGEHWRLLVAFPQKFYCGRYTTHLDLSQCEDARYLRAQWKMGRWTPCSNQDGSTPLFEFYLLAGELRNVAANAVG